MGFAPYGRIVVTPKKQTMRMKAYELGVVTSNQRHTGEDKMILAMRKQTMQQAKAQNPIRWGCQDIGNCEPVEPTTLNPVKEPEKMRLHAA